MLLKHCLNFGQMPGIWLRAIICPIPKVVEKDPCCLKSCRGISLLSSILKFYSVFVITELENIFTEKIICPKQFGFQRGKLCEGQVQY